MLTFIKRQFGLSKQRTHSAWYPLSHTPEGFWRPNTGDYRHATNHEANSLAPVYAAKDLYKRSMALCPLITYRRAGDGGRVRALSHPAYTILHDTPNPAMSRTTFLERFVDDYFTYGEFIAIIRWKGNNNVHGIYPVPHSSIVDVKLDEEWNKTYFIRDDSNQVQEYDSADVVHVIKDSKCGIRGTKLLDFAAENFGLHRQIAESANAFFKNAVQPSIYVNRLDAKGTPEILKREQEAFSEAYAGTKNAGTVPFLNNSTINSFPGLSAEEAGLLEAMNSSVADTARWFGCSASDLGDRENSKYSSLAADQASFFKLSLSPVQVKLQDEINLKLFGANSDTYAEFMTRGIVQGSPAEEQAILNGYIQSGVMTRAESRELLNLPAIPGLDTPLAPTNQAVITGAPDAQPLTDTAQPTDNPDTAQPEAVAPEAPIANSGLNGAQVASILEIVDKVALKQYPPETAISLIQAAFPLIDSEAIKSIVNSVANHTQPPAEGTSVNVNTPNPNQV